MNRSAATLAPVLRDLDGLEEKLLGAVAAVRQTKEVLRSLKFPAENNNKKIAPQTEPVLKSAKPEESHEETQTLSVTSPPAEEAAALSRLHQSAVSLTKSLHTELGEILRWNFYFDLSELLQGGVGSVLSSFQAVSSETVCAALSRFLSEGNKDDLEILLKVGADVNGPVDGKPPLIRAVSTFTSDSESASHPQQKTGSTTPLTLRERQAEAVGMLVEAGADVGVVEAERKETALHFVCCLCSSEKEDPETERETEELVKFLISRGANVNAEAKKGARPIHAAARFGTAKLIDLLVARGADLKAKDKNGNGVLFYAAAGDNKKSAEHLMNLGVDVNDENEVGCTCLLYTFGRRVDVDVGPLSEWVPAVPPDHAGLADLFVSRGGDVNGWDEEYSSPLLHQASFWGASGVVRVLLENGVDLDMVDENGNTALHDVGCHPFEEGGPAGPGGVRVLPYWGKSLRRGFYVKLLESRLEIGRLLVSFGVSANLLNNFGHTALSVATVGGLQGLRGGREIVSFLRSVTTQTAEETAQSQEESDGSASESESDDEEGEGSESSSESGSESEEEEGEEEAEEGEEE